MIPAPLLSLERLMYILYGRNFTIETGGNSYQPGETSREVHLLDRVGQRQRPGYGPTLHRSQRDFQTVSGLVSLTCPGLFVTPVGGRTRLVICPLMAMNSMINSIPRTVS